jgi:hypothetical protein
VADFQQVVMLFPFCVFVIGFSRIFVASKTQQHARKKKFIHEGVRAIQKGNPRDAHYSCACCAEGS